MLRIFQILLNSKLIRLIVIVPLLLQIFLPELILAQSFDNIVTSSSDGTEIVKTEDGNTKLIVDDNYKDPQIKNADVIPKLPEKVEYLNSSANDIVKNQGAVSEEIRNLEKNKPTGIKEVKLDDLVKLNVSSNENKSLRKENTTVFIKDGIKSVEKTAINKYESINGSLVEILKSIDSIKLSNGNNGYRIGNLGSKFYATFDEISKGGIILYVNNIQFKWVALSSNISKPEVLSNSIIYRNVWTDIDLVYTYDGESIKEDIIVKSPKANLKISFLTSGGVLTNSKTVKGAIDVKVGKQDMNIDAPLMLTSILGPVVDKQVVTQTSIGDKVNMSVDSKWVQSLTIENFPLTIDPGVIWGTRGAGSNYKAYARNGSWNQEYKQFSIGSTRLSNGTYNNWRAMAYFDYTELQSKNILGGYLHFPSPSYSLDPYYDVTINVKWAECFGFDCRNNSSPTMTGTITQSGGNIEMYPLLKWFQDNNIWGGWLIFWGTENSPNSYRTYPASGLSLNYAFNYFPNNNASVSYPTNGAVTSNPYQVLRINPATDPDSDLIEYNFQLFDQAGVLVQGNYWSSSASFVVMDGILQDGQTYSWRVYVKDPYYAYSNPSFTSSFKVDLRTGKDKTSAYDDTGPISTNLITGNLYTGMSSHTMNALGGNIGINLEYNTPYITQTGITAKYWNNNSFSGEPVYQRIEQKIESEFGEASPVPGVIATDNFSISYQGYFIAPLTGNYYFGSNRDDNSTIWVNNIVAFSMGCCGFNWGTTAVYLTEGQIASYQQNFQEIGGGATVNATVRLPSGIEMVIPTEYFRTAPVAISNSRGLTGNYYFDNGTHDFNQNKQRFLTRNDAVLNFGWDVNSPMVGGPTDNFLVRWEGYVTPPINGNYQFILGSDDGSRLWINDQQLIDKWVDQGITETTSSNIALTGGQSYRIIIEYFEHAGGAGITLKWNGPAGYQIIENKYLSPEARILSSGWNLSVDTDGNIPFESLKVRSTGDVTLNSSNGTSSDYTYSNGGYKPPVNEDGVLIKNSDNTYTYTTPGGIVYIFAVLDNSGLYKLKETSTPFDDKNPAGLRYEYSSVGGIVKLKKIIDGVDNSRFGTLYYQGESECEQLISYGPIPPGYLCAFVTTDGNKTNFQYLADGFLHTVQLPGNMQTHMSSYTDGKILGMRDSSMLDQIRAGVRTDDNGSLYAVAYDALGRVQTIYMPTLTNDTSNQLRHTIEYFPNKSKQHILGGGNQEPSGYSKYIEFDSLQRATKVCDKMALCTSTEWMSDKDIVLSSIGPTNQKTTTIYDSDDIPLESYGPAPASWFGVDRKPLASYITKVPHIETKYDEGILGPSVAWYDVKGNSFFGSPKYHTVGINDDKDYFRNEYYQGTPLKISKGVGMDGVGFSATGKLLFPQTTTYSFKLWHSDALRLWVDDILLIDKWSNRTTAGTPSYSEVNFNATAGKTYRFRLDYASYNGSHQANFFIKGAGIPNLDATYGSNRWGEANILKTALYLPTSTKVYDTELGNQNVKAIYSNPSYGLVDKNILDPEGLNYQLTKTFESPGTGYFRQLSKTTSGGSVTKYQHYGATEKRSNPCIVGSVEVSQAGMPKGMVNPSGMTSESVYDSSGRIVASRTNAEEWNCTTYDSRSRVIELKVASNNEKAGRTIKYNYAFGDNPSILVVTEVGSNSTYSKYNFLGQLVRYLDSNGNETLYSYDNLGRQYKKISFLGTEEVIYDSYDRIVQKKFDDTIYSNVSYDQYGRVLNITYPQAQQLSFIGTTRDLLDRPISQNWKLGDGKIVKDESIFSQSGVITQTKHSIGTTSYTQNYTYDKAGRLLSADYGDRQYYYDYKNPEDNTIVTPCGFPGSTKNFNRSSTRVIVNGVQEYLAGYCYDEADRLLSSTDTNIGTLTYDSHGNVTKIGGIELGYDISDRNISLQEEKKNINYERDLEDRVISKTSIINGVTSKERYIYSEKALLGIRDGFGNLLERYISLPGLTMIIKEPVGYGISRSEYRISSSQGHNLLTLNQYGTTNTIDRVGPYGEKINSSDKFSYAGSVLNQTDRNLSLEFIQMGARVYIPILGRFLSVDSETGGNKNDYVYPVDPINGNDFNGKWIETAFDVGMTALDANDCKDGDGWACVFTVVGVITIIVPVIPNITAVRRLGKGVDVATTVATKVDDVADITVSSEAHEIMGLMSKADIKYPELGHVSGTKKHSFVNKELLKSKSNLTKGKLLPLPNGKKARLDLMSTRSQTIYDMKFGGARMSKAQAMKYASQYPGYSVFEVKSKGYRCIICSSKIK